MRRAGSSPKGAARRDEILAIAMRMFAERGYEHTSLRAIARTLDVETAHILYYFGSREGLLLAVVQQWLGEAGGGELVDPLDRLDAFVGSIRRNARIPGIVKTYIALSAEAAAPGHVAHDVFRDRFVWLVDYLSTAVRAEQAAGRARADIDPEVQARALIALADGLQLQWLLNPATDVTAELMTAIAAIRRTV